MNNAQYTENAELTDAYAKADADNLIKFLQKKYTHSTEGKSGSEGWIQIQREKEKGGKLENRVVDYTSLQKQDLNDPSSPYVLKLSYPPNLPDALKKEGEEVLTVTISDLKKMVELAGIGEIPEVSKEVHDKIKEAMDKEKITDLEAIEAKLDDMKVGDVLVSGTGTERRVTSIEETADGQVLVFEKIKNGKVVSEGERKSVQYFKDLIKKRPQAFSAIISKKASGAEENKEKVTDVEKVITKLKKSEEVKSAMKNGVDVVTMDAIYEGLRNGLNVDLVMSALTNANERAQEIADSYMHETERMRYMPQYEDTLHAVRSGSNDFEFGGKMRHGIAIERLLITRLRLNNLEAAYGGIKKAIATLKKSKGVAYAKERGVAQESLDAIFSALESGKINLEDCKKVLSEDGISNIEGNVMSKHTFQGTGEGAHFEQQAKDIRKDILNGDASQLSQLIEYEIIAELERQWERDAEKNRAEKQKAKEAAQSPQVREFMNSSEASEIQRLGVREQTLEALFKSMEVKDSTISLNDIKESVVSIAKMAPDIAGKCQYSDHDLNGYKRNYEYIKTKYVDKGIKISNSGVNTVMQILKADLNLKYIVELRNQFEQSDIDTIFRELMPNGVSHESMGAMRVGMRAENAQFGREDIKSALRKAEQSIDRAKAKNLSGQDSLNFYQVQYDTAKEAVMNGEKSFSFVDPASGQTIDATNKALERLLVSELNLKVIKDNMANKQESQPYPQESAQTGPDQYKLIEENSDSWADMLKQIDDAKVVERGELIEKFNDQIQQMTQAFSGLDLTSRSRINFDKIDRSRRFFRDVLGKTFDFTFSFEDLPDVDKYSDASSFIKAWLGTRKWAKCMALLHSDKFAGNDALWNVLDKSQEVLYKAAQRGDIKKG